MIHSVDALHKLPPLLITATLNPGMTPYVALADTTDRVKGYMEGFLAWCMEPAISSIVFAKNCNTIIRYELLGEIASGHGKEFEFVQVDSSPRSIIQGKGFGEGDMIRQALDRSEILRSESEFIKVTGKLFCCNAAKLLDGNGRGTFFVSEAPADNRFNLIRRKIAPLYRSRSGSSLAAFLKYQCRIPWSWVAAVPGRWVDTRCYRVERDFYRMVLLHTHERVRDGLGYVLERAFHDDLESHAREVLFLNEAADMIGVSGSSGSRMGSFSEEILAEAWDMAAQILVD